MTVPLADVVNKTIAGTPGDDAYVMADGTKVLVPTDRYLTYDWLTYRTLKNDDGTDVIDPATGLPKKMVRGGDAGEIKPPTQKITGVVFNDADNDGINGTVNAGEGDEAADAPVKGAQLTLERFYTLAEDLGTDEASVEIGRASCRERV